MARGVVDPQVAAIHSEAEWLPVDVVATEGHWEVVAIQAHALRAAVDELAEDFSVNEFAEPLPHRACLALEPAGV